MPSCSDQLPVSAQRPLSTLASYQEDSHPSKTCLAYMRIGFCHAAKLDPYLNGELDVTLCDVGVVALKAMALLIVTKISCIGLKIVFWKAAV